MISCVIPTIGRIEMLPTCLTSLVFQIPTLIKEIIILDEAKSPISESYAVNQALDYASLSGIDVKILRNRNRKGVGAARYALAEEAKHEYVLMVDDDVAVVPGCVEKLLESLDTSKSKWAVPTCTLISAALELDGYVDSVVSRNDPRVLVWTEKYPWFIPYFKYDEVFEEKLSASGTQCILFEREALVEECRRVAHLGKLPREDTYLTVKLGPGIFNSEAECLHFEHVSQADRGNWSKSMFYRLHEAILKNPEAFIDFMGYSE